MLKAPVVHNFWWSYKDILLAAVGKDNSHFALNKFLWLFTYSIVACLFCVAVLFDQLKLIHRNGFYMKCLQQIYQSKYIIFCTKMSYCILSQSWSEAEAASLRPRILLTKNPLSATESKGINFNLKRIDTTPERYPPSRPTSLRREKFCGTYLLAHL